jgi:uncharacterized membrane protein YhhN
MKKIFFSAFVVSATLHVVGVCTGTEILSTISKPVLMPFLALWLICETPGIQSSLRTGWLGGLFFSTVGDILLMFEGGLFFLLGLSAFLLAHFSFIWAMATGLRNRRGYLNQKPGWLAPFLLYPLLLLYWLWNGIPEGMRAPVAIYATVISMMALSVLHLRGFIAEKVFWTMIAGASLFVLSDSLIAVSKFGHPFGGAHSAIIVTYILGQWLLAKGVAAILLDPSSTKQPSPSR